MGSRSNGDRLTDLAKEINERIQPFFTDEGNDEDEKEINKNGKR